MCVCVCVCVRERVNTLQARLSNKKQFSVNGRQALTVAITDFYYEGEEEGK